GSAPASHVLGMARFARNLGERAEERYGPDRPRSTFGRACGSATVPDQPPSSPKSGPAMHLARFPRVHFAHLPTPLEPMPNLTRSEEHTSELQSRENLVCRLLLEK